MVADMKTAGRLGRSSQELGAPFGPGALATVASWSVTFLGFDKSRPVRENRVCVIRLHASE